MHLQVQQTYYLDTDNVYKSITFRIDEKAYLILRKQFYHEWVFKRINECEWCLRTHLFKHMQTKHVTYNTVHGDVY